MKKQPATPSLRLAGGKASTSAWRNKQNAIQSIVRSNRLAATTVSTDPEMDPTDPRWVFAVRTHSQLQGDVLSPERRDKLLKLATQLEIRPFDANVIIAVVQDHARRHIPLSQVTTTLSLISPREERLESTLFHIWRWLAVIACAVMATSFLIHWVMSA